MNFGPWLAYLDKRHQEWFSEVFRILSRRCFHTYECCKASLIDGKALTFDNGNATVRVSRWLDFSELDERPGIVILNKDDSYSMEISVWTPIEVVELAIVNLAPDHARILPTYKEYSA
jgi:hypothetical protein